MGLFRTFSVQEGFVPSVREVKDAPAGMRVELIDLFFYLAEKAEAHAMKKNTIPLITPVDCATSLAKI